MSSGARAVLCPQFILAIFPWQRSGKLNAGPLECLLLDGTGLADNPAAVVHDARLTFKKCRKVSKSVECYDSSLPIRIMSYSALFRQSADHLLLAWGFNALGEMPALARKVRALEDSEGGFQANAVMS